MSSTTLPKSPKYLGPLRDFPQRTYDKVRQTPFLPEFDDTGMWRSPVHKPRIEADLKEFVLTSRDKLQSQLLELAIQKISEAFRLPEHVKPIHLNDIFSLDLDIWDESPEQPWVNLGYKTKGAIRADPEAIQRVRKFAHLIKSGQNMKFPDCMAFVRSHTCEYGEYKVRAVWGYPATVTVMEAMFAAPLIRAYQKLPLFQRPIAYGFETAIGGMKRCLVSGKRYKKFSGIASGSYFTQLSGSVCNMILINWMSSEQLTALLFPERPDKEFADLQNRALGLYYVNMCVDEEFARICKTIIGLRPFDLAFTSKKISIHIN